MLIASFYVFVNLAGRLALCRVRPAHQVRLIMSIAPSTLPAPMSEIRQPRAYVEFCRQQPLGAISFAIICAMMIAGIFCEWVCA